MISKSTKTYEIDGEKMQFNFDSFKDGFHLQRKREQMKVQEYEEKLAENLHVSADAVHNWRFGCNGPSDISIVKQIAALFHFTDWRILLKKQREENNMKQLNERQKDSVKRIYDEIIDFLNEFETTDGFTTNLWYEYVRQGEEDPESCIYEYARNKVDKILLIIKKEYFDLHGTNIYDELYEYVNNDLVDTFDGKLGYAYRFEAFAEGNPTTEEDYEKALNKINEVIERYE